MHARPARTLPPAPIAALLLGIAGCGGKGTEVSDAVVQPAPGTAAAPAPGASAPAGAPAAAPARAD